MRREQGGMYTSLTFSLSPLHHTSTPPNLHPGYSKQRLLAIKVHFHVPICHSPSFPPHQAKEWGSGDPASPVVMVLEEAKNTQTPPVKDRHTWPALFRARVAGKWPGERCDGKNFISWGSWRSLGVGGQIMGLRQLNSPRQFT